MAARVSSSSSSRTGAGVSGSSFFAFRNEHERWVPSAR
jgi:hypothetical protein